MTPFLTPWQIEGFSFIVSLAISSSYRLPFFLSLLFSLLPEIKDEIKDEIKEKNEDRNGWEKCERGFSVGAPNQGKAKGFALTFSLIRLTSVKLFEAKGYYLPK